MVKNTNFSHRFYAEIVQFAHDGAGGGSTKYNAYFKGEERKLLWKQIHFAYYPAFLCLILPCRCDNYAPQYDTGFVQFISHYETPGGTDS